MAVKHLRGGYSVSNRGPFVLFTWPDGRRNTWNVHTMVCPGVYSIMWTASVALLHPGTIEFALTIGDLDIAFQYAAPPSQALEDMEILGGATRDEVDQVRYAQAIQEAHRVLDDVLSVMLEAGNFRRG